MSCDDVKISVAIEIVDPYSPNERGHRESGWVIADHVVGRELEISITSSKENPDAAEVARQRLAAEYKIRDSVAIEITGCDCLLESG